MDTSPPTVIRQPVGFASAPLVSIALCTYNGARFLREQLDSLFAQTHQDFEIVAVDDCSTDNTVAILHEYAQRDARLHVYVNRVNAGISNNFAIAAQFCRGTFIAPCDQDDIWVPEKIATLLQVIGTNMVAYCDSELIAETGESLGCRVSDFVNLLTTHDPSGFLFANCVSGHAMLLRRAVLDHAMPLPDAFPYDWWLATVGAAYGGTICHRYAMVKYRQHGNNLTDMRYGSSRIEKPKGHKLKALRAIERRIDLLAALPGPQQSRMMKLQQLWKARESQWISIALVWFLAFNGLRLYATNKRVSYWFVFRRAKYYFWGIRAKRLADPYAYAIQAMPERMQQGKLV